MKNTIITILSISTLVLAFIQIKTCSTTSPFSPSGIDNLTDEQKLESFRFLQKSIFDSNTGAHVKFDKGQKLTNEFLNYHNSPNPTAFEKSVFFYERDLQNLFSGTCNSGNRGIRVYFAKYPDNDTLPDGSKHPYAKKFTVVLRATCDNNDLPYTGTQTDRYVAYDYGDICPPHCKPPMPDNRQKTDYENCTNNGNKSTGGYYEKDPK
jgi:hypothetical protein